MCDERLSSSPEAMLSRISELENKQFFAPAPAVIVDETASIEASAEKPKRTPKKPKFDDDDEDFRFDAPTSIKKTEKAPATAINDKNVRVLRPFKSRAEVLDKMRMADPISAPFFKNAKWYTDESGKIILKFGNTYEINQACMFGGDITFLRIVSQITGKTRSKSDLVCEAEAENKNNELIDKILEAAEN